MNLTPENVLSWNLAINYWRDRFLSAGFTSSTVEQIIKSCVKRAQNSLLTISEVLEIQYNQLLEGKQMNLLELVPRLTLGEFIQRLMEVAPDRWQMFNGLFLETSSFVMLPRDNSVLCAFSKPSIDVADIATENGWKFQENFFGKTTMPHDWYYQEFLYNTNHDPKKNATRWGENCNRLRLPLMYVKSYSIESLDSLLVEASHAGLLQSSWHQRLAVRCDVYRTYQTTIGCETVRNGDLVFRYIPFFRLRFMDQWFSLSNNIPELQPPGQRIEIENQFKDIDWESIISSNVDAVTGWVDCGIYHLNWQLVEV